jgi:hypothetical protein
MANKRELSGERGTQPLRPNPQTVVSDDALLVVLNDDSTTQDQRAAAFAQCLGVPVEVVQSKHFCIPAPGQMQPGPLWVWYLNSARTTRDKLFPPKQPWQSVHELQATSIKFGTYRLFFAECEDSMTAWGHTRQKLMQDATLPNDNAALVRKFMVRGMQSVLPIVAGESGSGKTHLLLTCELHAFTVYVPCLPASLADPPTVPQPKVSQRWITEMASYVSRPVLQGRAPPAAWEQPLHLIIAFDEMGLLPNALRMLCRHRQAVCDLVAQLCCAASVRMIAAGTGVDNATAQPGSGHNTYKVITLKPDPFVWRDFVKQAQPALRGTLNMIADVLRGLVCNPRAAVILTQQVQKVIGAHARDVERQSSILRYSMDALLGEVASRYKNMNSMRDFDADETLWRCAAAFRAVHCPSAQFDEDIIGHLVSKCGLITDHRRRKQYDTAAEFRNAYNTDKLEAKADLERIGKTLEYYLTPKTGRFKMSAAIGLMVLNRFGLLQTNFNSGTSGNALEELVFAKIALAFSLTGTLREALEALKIPVVGIPKNTVGVGFRGNVVQLRAEHPIAKGDVENGAEPTWVTDEAKEEISIISTELKTARAVVVMNCKGAPHADIIVAVRGWLGFFQTKHVDAETVPFVEELDKTHVRPNKLARFPWPKDANVTALLRTVTGTENRSPHVVFVRSGDQSGNDGPPSDFEGSGHVCVLDEHSGFLEPLLWPQQAPYQRRTQLTSVEWHPAVQK